MVHAKEIRIFPRLYVMHALLQHRGLNNTVVERRERGRGRACLDASELVMQKGVSRTE